MRKTLAFAAFALLFASSSFANYMVVLKNGTQYEAQAKWTIVNGKAQFRTKAGQLIAIDATLIDEAKSERATRLGLGGDAKELDLSPNLPSTGTTAKPAQSLGSAIRLRKPNEVQPQAETTATTQFDKLSIQILNSSGTLLSTLATYSNLNASASYAQKTFDVTSFKGQTIRVRFNGTEDSSLQTSFLVDDTALNVQ